MMNSRLTSENVTNAAQFKEFLQQGLAEMDCLFAVMAEDQKEIDRLTASFQADRYEIRRLREDNERRDKDAARERENLILRLENQLLRAERGLPPPNAGDTRD